MSRPDGSWNDYINNHRYAILATQRRSGGPQQTMVLYWFDGENFNISVSGLTQKAKNVGRHPEVSLAIVDGRQQLIVYGKADLITELDEVAGPTRDIARHGGVPEQSDEEFMEFLKSGQRVVIVVRPERFYPPTMPEA